VTWSENPDVDPCDRPSMDHLVLGRHGERSDASDRTLLEAIARGDTDALRGLYDRHDTWIRARLRRRCLDDDLVSEAVQDTFVAVWTSASSYRGAGDPAAWLWGIAIRRLISAQRTRYRWPPAMDGADVGAAERGFDRAGDHLDLMSAMSRLPDELAAVVRATYLDELTVAEASALLGIPPGTVKTRVRRAKAMLRGTLR
jgi:RNA polymerase sigma-70 factor, ECF subfamily